MFLFLVVRLQLLLKCGGAGAALCGSRINVQEEYGQAKPDVRWIGLSQHR